MRKIAALVFEAGLGSVAFAYGPLLPWSPVKPGYTAAAFPRAEVFFSNAAALPDDYRDIDAVMADAERFHGLRFQRPVRVTACKNWGGWLRVHSLGGITLATGDVIYITPKLAEMHFHTREFLSHELSHALIDQNTSLIKAHRINEASWLSEGWAVSFGRQRDYYSRSRFLEAAGRLDLAGYLDPARPASPWNARFAYPAQRYFVEYLKHRDGEAAFARYLPQAIANPRAASTSLFERHFRSNFHDAIAACQRDVRAGAWPPVSPE